MGLKRNLARSDNSLRFEFQNAYFKISKSEMNNERNKLIISVKAYGDEAARRYEESSTAMPMPGMSSSRVVFEKTYEADPTTVPAHTTATTLKDQLIQSSYLWLKQNSGDFANATDVLESGQS